MKNLKEYIIEGIFDIDDNIDNIDKSIKDQIKQFLKNNFKGYSSCRINRKLNADGKFVVSSSKDIQLETNITSLTNGLFVWNIVGGNFECYSNKSLKSLEGAPKKVHGVFNCSGCDSLTSLKGAPKEVGGGCYCSNCNSLTSLEGAPKEVGMNFICNRCNSLISLKGAPEKVGGDFDCYNCGKQFTEEDVKKVSDVRGEIHY